jgi:hypothetical protein
MSSVRFDTHVPGPNPKEKCVPLSNALDGCHRERGRCLLGRSAKATPVHENELLARAFTCGRLRTHFIA